VQAWVKFTPSLQTRVLWDKLNQEASRQGWIGIWESYVQSPSTPTSAQTNPPVKVLWFSIGATSAQSRLIANPAARVAHARKVNRKQSISIVEIT
jgi:hypothetical protein